jgi:DNA-directed RNA polymerase specialized sigma24 family protein
VEARDSTVRRVYLVTKRRYAAFVEQEATTITNLACAECVAHLAEVEFQLLPETDAEVVTEHLSECPDCRLFKEQLDSTRDLLAATPAPELTTEIADVLKESQSELADSSIESLDRLYRVAAALDVEDTDELVQQTLLDAVSEGATLDSGALIDRLTRAAAETGGHPTESLDEADPDSMAYDPDSETAELFYPEFYEDGPDAGRFVDSPNAWGQAFRLAPEDDVTTIELFGVTDSAIDELPEAGMRLITLVDIEGVSLDDAARALRVNKARAAQALNSARIHVRGAIDNYLKTAEA